jgi:hypothetical protein
MFQGNPALFRIIAKAGCKLIQKVDGIDQPQFTIKQTQGSWVISVSGRASAIILVMFELT